jgi:predicted fused transcriptional regulator/phosphomethylpyrimidine kinase
MSDSVAVSKIELGANEHMARVVSLVAVLAGRIAARSVVAQT